MPDNNFCSAKSKSAPRPEKSGHGALGSFDHLVDWPPVF
jgi:hypothetical protein